jgi:diguanylate cyclase (GGDEF)-like protein/PAS domain S-box-containing protein
MSDTGRTKEELIKELAEARKRIDDLEASGAKDRPAYDRQVDSQRLLGKVFESIRDPLCIVNSDYIIVKTNEEYAQRRRKTVKDLVGKKCYEVLYSKNGVCNECVVEKSFISRDPCAKVKFSFLPDGTEEWQEIYTYPIINDQGNVSHVIEYFRDITERKLAESSREKLLNERKIMEEKLKKLATTDRLTQAYNRLKFEEIIGREKERSKRYGQPLSMIMLDIDHFKGINDRYGHIVGDYILKSISDLIRKNIRKVEYFIRWGGEEFMIVASEADLEKARALAERIRQVTEDFRFDEAGRVTLSLGVTQFRGDDTEDNFLKRADDALYKAKVNGRNRVEVIP